MLLGTPVPKSLCSHLPVGDGARANRARPTGGDGGGDGGVIFSVCHAPDFLAARAK